MMDAVIAVTTFTEVEHEWPISYKVVSEDDWRARPRNVRIIDLRSQDRLTNSCTDDIVDPS